eukprot:3719705-Prymnesium_polylepis.1
MKALYHIAYLREVKASKFDQSEAPPPRSYTSTPQREKGSARGHGAPGHCEIPRLVGRDVVAKESSSHLLDVLEHHVVHDDEDHRDCAQ